MYKYLLMGLILLSGQLFANDFTIIEENANMAVLEFNLGNYKLQDVTIDGITYQEIISKYTASADQLGVPLLPIASGILGIPTDGDIRIEVLETEEELISDVLILPAQSENIDKLATEFIRDENIYSTAALYPLNVIKKGKAAFLGNRHFTSILAFPFQMRCASRELKVTKRLKLRIHIMGTKTANRDAAGDTNIIDAAADDFFLNNQSSQLWRKAKVRTQHTANRDFEERVSRIQIIVNQPGIYKLTKQDIREGLADWETEKERDLDYSFDLDNIDPRRLELYDENGPVPIHISGENDGHFGEADYLEFYGDIHYGDTGWMDEYTQENTYTLILKDSGGTRMAVENGGLLVNSTSYTKARSYLEKIHFEEQLISEKLGHYLSNAGIEGYSPSNVWREDRWFWLSITAPELKAIVVNLEYPSDRYDEFFSISGRILGRSYPSTSLDDSVYDHHAILRFNTTLVDELYWVGQDDLEFKNTENLYNSSLLNGENRLYVSLLGDAYNSHEAVLLDYFDVEYWRLYKTDRDYMKFSKPNNKPQGMFQFELHGFSERDVSVYKIGSSRIENLRIESFSEGDVAPFTVSFQDSVFSNNIQYYAVAENKKKKPLFIRPDIPSDIMNQANAANYIIITHEDFVDAEGTILLKETHERAGSTVAIVSVQDIYDEFNGGIASADAIRAFLKYAYNNWNSPQLTHLLLLGDGLEDERDNSPNRRFNILPIRYVWTYDRGATASDTWYGAIIGDDPVPDIAIGRVPVWEKEQILDVAQKVQAYIETPENETHWGTHVTLVAGQKLSEFDDRFARQNEAIRRDHIPAEMNCTRVYGSTVQVSSKYRGNTYDLRENINKGSMYVQFMGHGGGQVWSDHGLLKQEHIPQLTNVNLPFMASLSCYGSNFEEAKGTCIGESLILVPEHGAIGQIGFTGFGYLSQDEIYGEFLVDALFNPYLPTQGEKCVYTMAKFFAKGYSLASYSLTWGSVLLGDPNVKLKHPDFNVQVSLDRYNAAIGDTIIVTATFPEGNFEARIAIENSLELPVNVPYNEIDFPVINNTLVYKYVVSGESPTDQIFTRKVRVLGYSETRSVAGLASFTVGKTAAVDVRTIPEHPQKGEDIFVTALLFDKDGIAEAYLIKRNASGASIELQTPMVEDQDKPNCYYSTETLPSLDIFETYEFYFEITDLLGNQYDTDVFTYKISGIDLLINNTQFVQYNDKVAIKTLIQNFGDVESPACDLKVYRKFPDFTRVIIDSITIEPMRSLEKRFEYVVINELMDYGDIEIEVNPEKIFIERFYRNNVETIVAKMNIFAAGYNEFDYVSPDQNIQLNFSENFLPREAVFRVDVTDSLAVTNQPATVPVMLYNGAKGIAYQIDCLDDELLADNLGHFLDNKRLSLRFAYDTSEDHNEEYNKMGVYRYEPRYKKWIFQGGERDERMRLIVQKIDRLGTYGLFRNTDKHKPSIDANVEEQEFTYGGVISGHGVISFLLSDANGIDIFDNCVQIFLNGQQLEEGGYSQAFSPGHLTNVPIKYQLNLTKGDYYLSINCVDVNGNYSERGFDFEVSDEFKIRNLANYPNPVVIVTQEPQNEGRTRFTYTLTDDADYVELKVFTVNGRLVKTFRNLPRAVGYHEYPRTVYAWDVKDENGNFLANGVYFYKLIAKRGKKKIEKIQKLAIAK